MKIEEEILKNTKVKFNQLESYGFVKHNQIYQYSKVFLDQFRADIRIDSSGVLSGKVFDQYTKEEYTNFRLTNQNGKFVSLVRDEYKKILMNIVENCFEKQYFNLDQANRITKKIIELYKDEPQFVWEKFPGYGIFKNPESQKWYGLIFNIDKSKVDPKSKGEIEAINVKLESSKIAYLLTKKGFYPAYHMNKTNWITIILDDTVKDEEIIACIKESHQYTEKINEWIIPIDQKNYHCFQDCCTITYRQEKIKKGDLVYLYVLEPFSALCYQCKVNDIASKDLMTLKIIEKLKPEEYSSSKLAEYGIKKINNIRKMPKKLSQKINRKKEFIC